MRRLLLAATMLAALPAAADERFEATLAGHAVLPAFTMALPPADAPRDALLSGKFAGPGNLRIDAPGAVMGDTGALHGNRPTGIAFPLIGQPVQGFSGIKPVTGEAGVRPTPEQPCFPLPARFKRVYLVDLAQVDADGFMRKIGHIDLMVIRDPEGRARLRGDLPADAPRDRFTFSFSTIENVAAVDGEHIIVGNDNNLPFSAGRRFVQADDNEFVLLRVPEFLRAR